LNKKPTDYYRTVDRAFPQWRGGVQTKHCWIGGVVQTATSITFRKSEFKDQTLGKKKKKTLFNGRIKKQAGKAKRGGGKTWVKKGVGLWDSVLGCLTGQGGGGGKQTEKRVLQKKPGKKPKAKTAMYGETLLVKKNQQLCHLLREQEVVCLRRTEIKAEGGGGGRPPNPTANPPHKC